MFSNKTQCAVFLKKNTSGGTNLLFTKSAQKFCAKEFFPKAWVIENFFVFLFWLVSKSHKEKEQSLQFISDVYIHVNKLQPTKIKS